MTAASTASKLLAGVPQQAGAPVAEQARTWSFINFDTGEPMQVTCMPGCVNDHSRDMATPTIPQDIFCTAPKTTVGVTLPVSIRYEPELFRVLNVELTMEPYSNRLAERLPHATVEVLDEHYIQGLDPDGLATVINTLAQQVERMRDTHAQLVELRAQYLGQA